MTKGHSRGHLSWPQHATTWSQEWRNDVKPCLQSSSKRLLETCIALDWMACYKRIAEIANIFKTGHLHLCMGSNTNRPRVNWRSCTLPCFTWPVQIVNNYAHNMCRSPSYRSWLWKYLASEARSTGRSPVQIMGWTHRLCALASQQQAKFIKFISRFGLELWKLSDLLAGDAAILQVGMKIASNQRPFQFQTQLFNCINGQNPSRSGRSSVSTRMLLLPRSNSHLLRLDLESHRSGAFVAQIGAPTIRKRDLDPWT